MSILAIILLVGAIVLLMGLAVYRQVCSHLELRKSLHRYESSFNTLVERVDAAVGRLEAARRERFSQRVDIVLTREEDPEEWGGWVFGVIECKASPTYLRRSQLLHGAMAQHVINYYLARSRFDYAGSMYSAVSSYARPEKPWQQEDSPAYA